MAAHEKLLPQNVEAEAGVLGSVLIDAADVPLSEQHVLADLRTVGLTPDDFYREHHRLIYQAMLDLADASMPADMLTVIDELTRRGQLDDMGGTSAVSSLANEVPTSKSAKAYARIVKRCAQNRRLIHAAGQIAGVAYSEENDAVALAQAELLIEDVRKHAVATEEDVFPLLTVDELEDMPPARGLIGDVLYEMTLAILYGPSQRWKSFVALAWALCIAAGIPWMGKPTMQGDVVYVAAEGGAGIGPRVMAWRIKHGVTRDAVREHFRPLTVPVRLLDPSQVDKLIRTIQRACPTPALIVFDTLSRSMAGGDENNGKDGSTAIAAADAVREALGCTVLFVAHPGKDERLGIRGWSGYFAAADTVISAKGGADKPRLDPGEPVTLTCEKPKDAEPFSPITFTTEVVRMTDEQGNTLRSSLVVVPSEDACTVATPVAQITKKRQLALDALIARGRLSSLEWQRVSGLSSSAFFEALRQFQSLSLIEMGDDGKYTATLPAPVTPLRSGLTPAGVLRSPDHSGYSGVSIDTGVTGAGSGRSFVQRE